MNDLRDRILAAVKTDLVDNLEVDQLKGPQQVINKLWNYAMDIIVKGLVETEK